MDFQPATGRKWANLAAINVLIFLAMVGLVLAAVLRATHGHFTYSLDDPYIHLALAKRLQHGLYGINAGEPASPSSSILWPLLLVSFAGLKMFAWLPLILNTLFGAATVYALARFVQRYFLYGLSAWLLALLLAAALNLVGLVYTGLEHSLEILLCLLSASAVLAVLDGRRIPNWSIAAAFVLPMVRYEGLLITFGVAVALWAVERRRAAFLLLAGSIIPLIVFGAYLHHLHLPVFPLSVLQKSGSKFQDRSNLLLLALRLARETLTGALEDPERAPQLLIVVVLGSLSWWTRRLRGIAMTLCGVSLVGLVQVALGPVGWFYRYELYCLAFTIPIAVAASSRLPALLAAGKTNTGVAERAGQLTGAMRQGRALTFAPQPVPGLLLVAVGSLAMFYGRPLLGTARAANGIWQQQAQLGRFASDFYTGPVAVNDLGWVSYLRSPDQFTLDLVGLGSAEVHATRARNRNASWLDAITRSHQVGLVMIFPEWFPLGLPQSWTPLAQLCTADADLTLGAGGTRVVFYATPTGDQARLRDALAAFQKGLPAGSALETVPNQVVGPCSKK